MASVGLTRRRVAGKLTTAGLTLGSTLLVLVVQSQHLLGHVSSHSQGTGSKPPVVLFDEAHFNVHTRTDGYRGFADLMEAEGYQVTVASRAPINRDMLAAATVLISVAPRGADPSRDKARLGEPAFTPAECDAITAWVRAGGSLLLVVDHPPTGASAQVLAVRFGVDLRDSTAMDDTPGTHIPSRPDWLLFSTANGLLGVHPILAGRTQAERVPGVVSVSGQSVTGPVAAVPLLKLSSTAYDKLSNGTIQPAAGRTQGVALSFGSGRVVVLGEAAMIKDGTPGLRIADAGTWGIDNRRFAVNIVGWLSRVLN